VAPREHALNSLAQSRSIPINIIVALELTTQKHIVGDRTAAPSWGVKLQVICSLIGRQLQLHLVVLPLAT
jgi:hypothetical protein